jgi:mercuric ion binding protein
MKTLRIFSIAVFSMACVSVASAQSKTETFKVSGNCGMCKNKIEKAAKEAGAKSAVWDVESKIITVTYKSSSTNTAKIQEKIAEVGYDNAGAKTTTEAYDKLHGCCKYDREEKIAKAACCDDATCTHHEGSSATHTAKLDCCKDGKCTMPGHSGKDCCKDGKCTMTGTTGKACCKKAEKPQQ